MNSLFTENFPYDVKSLRNINDFSFKTLGFSRFIMYNKRIAKRNGKDFTHVYDFDLR